VARYGQSIGSSNKDVPGGLGDSYTLFEKNGFMIGIILFKGIVGTEVIYKADKSEFSDNEKQTLLDADSASLHWTTHDTSDVSGEVWIRDDHAVARYDIISHVMTIESKEYYEAAQTKKASDEKTKLKDF
jgi:hypothetical protein